MQRAGGRTCRRRGPRRRALELPPSRCVAHPPERLLLHRHRVVSRYGGRRRGHMPCHAQRCTDIHRACPAVRRGARSSASRQARAEVRGTRRRHRGDACTRMRPRAEVMHQCTMSCAPPAGPRAPRAVGAYRDCWGRPECGAMRTVLRRVRSCGGAGVTARARCRGWSGGRAIGQGRRRRRLGTEKQAETTFLATRCASPPGTEPGADTTERSLARCARVRAARTRERVRMSTVAGQEPAICGTGARDTTHARARAGAAAQANARAPSRCGAYRRADGTSRRGRGVAQRRTWGGVRTQRLVGFPARVTVSSRSSATGACRQNPSDRRTCLFGSA